MLLFFSNMVKRISPNLRTAFQWKHLTSIFVRYFLIFKIVLDFWEVLDFQEAFKFFDTFSEFLEISFLRCSKQGGKCIGKGGVVPPGFIRGLWSLTFSASLSSSSPSSSSSSSTVKPNRCCKKTRWSCYKPCRNGDCNRYKTSPKLV